MQAKTLRVNRGEFADFLTSSNGRDSVTPAIRAVDLAISRAFGEACFAG
jgi:hypothetical protein